VVLRILGSNLVIFLSRLIEFCLFPSPSRRLKFCSAKKPEISGHVTPETPETPGKSAETPYLSVEFA
jgi:hypothetical protein